MRTTGCIECQPTLRSVHFVNAHFADCSVEASEELSEGLIVAAPEYGQGFASAQSDRNRADVLQEPITI
jgi:hypothetical protein